MTHLVHCHDRGNDTEGRKRGDAMLEGLARTQRYGGQEISLEVADGGWKISVFSCHGSRDTEIIIFIPADHREPPTIREVIPE